MDYLRKYTWVGKDLPTFPLPVRMQYRVQRAWEWIGLHTCLLPTLLPTTDHHTCCHQVFLPSLSPSSHLLLCPLVLSLRNSPLSYSFNQSTHLPLPLFQNILYLYYLTLPFLRHPMIPLVYSSLLQQINARQNKLSQTIICFLQFFSSAIFH